MVHLHAVRGIYIVKRRGREATGKECCNANCFTAQGCDFIPRPEGASCGHMTAMRRASAGLEAKSASVGNENESVPKNMMEYGGIDVSAQEATARDGGDCSSSCS